MTAVRAAAAVALLLLALPAAAASPSPAPEDRTTSVTVSPSGGVDRSTLVLRGFSDCAVIDGHLVFTTYDGKADNVVVRSTAKTYDYGREKYPFTVRLTVPAQAAPGAAKVYAEPFCGPPEEYPTSAVLPFRVLASPPHAATGHRAAPGTKTRPSRAAPAAPAPPSATPSPSPVLRPGTPQPSPAASAALTYRRRMVLAHGGGLPETATVLIPLLVVGAFVFQERRNVRRLREREAAEQGDDPGAS